MYKTAVLGRNADIKALQSKARCMLTLCTKHGQEAANWYGAEWNLADGNSAFTLSVSTITKFGFYFVLQFKIPLRGTLGYCHRQI